MDNYLSCVLSSAEFSKHFEKEITDRFWKFVSLSDLSFLFYSLLWNYDKAKEFADLVNDDLMKWEDAKKITAEKNGKKNVGDKQRRMQLYNDVHAKMKKLKMISGQVIAEDYKKHREAVRQERQERARMMADAASEGSQESLHPKRVFEPIPAFAMDAEFMGALGIDLETARHQNLVQGNVHAV